MFCTTQIKKTTTTYSVFSLSCCYCFSDTLVAVLERDTLGVREVRLFGAAVRWAEAEAHRQQLQPTPENKRRVLGKALTLIRFPLMTIEEFAAGMSQYALPVLRPAFPAIVMKGLRNE